MRGGLRVVLLVTAVVGMGTLAHADRVTDIPDMAPRLSLSKRVTKNLTLLSHDLNAHLNNLSFDVLEMRFDLGQRTAELKLAVDVGSGLGLRVDSDIKFRSGYARVKAKIDLRVIGEDISLDLPEFDMVPRTYAGRSFVELRLPLFEREF
jgi:hypothetical protein